jgi:DNA-binding SARP family transcriptional activator/Flp pilus assembly protein TadD
MLELQTLGKLDLRRGDGRPLAGLLTQPRRIALLCYLAAATPTGFHRRASVLALFWPERDEHRARAALRQAVYFLRRSLGNGTILSRGSEELGVDRRLLWCDAVAFAEALRERRFEDALTLYRGDLLEGFFVEDGTEFLSWLEGERSRLRSRAVAAAWELSEASETKLEISAAVYWAVRAFDFTPIDEIALRRLLQLLVRSGDRASALRIYALFERRLTEEYEIEPTAQTKAFVDTLRSFQTHVLLVPRAPRVAVLPFRAVPLDADTEALGIGMSDEIASRLARCGAVELLSRGSVMEFRRAPGTAKRVSAILNADYVIEGSVQREGDTIRVAASLLDPNSHQPLWTESYVPVRDISTVQHEIAVHVARALNLDPAPLELRPGSNRPTTDSAAFRAYMLGRYFLLGTEAEQLKSAEYFTRAIELDSAFAHAHLSLASLQMLMGQVGIAPPETIFPQAKGHIERALVLNNSLWEAHAALAEASFWWDWNWAEAKNSYQKAKQIAPAASIDSYVLFCMAQGQTNEAVHEAERGVELDPLSPVKYIMLGWTYTMLGRHYDALAQFRTALEIRRDFSWPHVQMAFTYVQMGKQDDALRCAETAETFLGPDPFLRAFVGYCYAAAGAMSQARRILLELTVMASERYVDACALAVLHTAVGDNDYAFVCLERAYAERSPNMVFLGLNESNFFARISSDDRYGSLLKRMNLRSPGLVHV